MLYHIIDVVGPKVPAPGVRIVETERIVLVVAHNGQRLLVFHHVADDAQCFGNLFPAVDEVAHKKHLAFRVHVAFLALFVAEFAQEGFQLVGMSVNIANEIVHKFT